MRRAWLLGVMAIAPVVHAHAAQPASPPANAELLEFLGSIDGEEGWQEFLEQMPLKRTRSSAAPPAAKPAEKPAAKAPPAEPAPAVDEAGKVKSK